jgi:hypothetical protein
MTLFDECLEALARDRIVLSGEKTKEMIKIFISTFLITNLGAIDWALVQNKYQVRKLNDIVEIIKERKVNIDKRVFIFWDNTELLSISAGLETTLVVIYDVIAVGFDTWIYCPDEMYVIEFHHEGRITIGFA